MEPTTIWFLKKCYSAGPLAETVLNTTGSDILLSQEPTQQESLSYSITENENTITFLNTGIMDNEEE